MSNLPNQSLAFGPASTIAHLGRDELYLIAREGISNAATYSNAGEIMAEPDIAENHVRAVVEDGGRGYEPGEEAKVELSLPLAGGRR